MRELQLAPKTMPTTTACHGMPHCSLLLTRLPSSLSLCPLLLPRRARFYRVNWVYGTARRSAPKIELLGLGNGWVDASLHCVSAVTLLSGAVSCQTGPAYLAR